LAPCCPIPPIPPIPPWSPSRCDKTTAGDMSTCLSGSAALIE
jgi:hypothetical protein